jgi:hypothetical protein
MDDEDHYLLSAHVGAGILYVIDVRTTTLVRVIHGVPGITVARIVLRGGIGAVMATFYAIFAESHV